MTREAIISECGKYRYLLRRIWERDRPRILFVMLNPSTADAEVDDATIRSCIRLAKGLGYGSLEVVNLMAWRATNPKDIPPKPSDAMGSDNPRTVNAAIERCSVVICAWGAHPYAKRFAGGTTDLCKLNGKIAYCFGITKSGAPKHPLYIKSGTPLQVYQ